MNKVSKDEAMLVLQYLELVLGTEDGMSVTEASEILGCDENVLIEAKRKFGRASRIIKEQYK